MCSRTCVSSFSLKDRERVCLSWSYAWTSKGSLIQDRISSRSRMKEETERNSENRKPCRQDPERWRRRLVPAGFSVS